MKPSEQLRQWLDWFIANNQPQTRLPTVNDLARTWGLSATTVTRILSRYRDDGTIVRIPRLGTFIAGEELPRGACPAPPRSSAESIVHEIGKAIGCGQLKKGNALPSIKLMSAQFKVGAPTVIRAYRMLREKGVITKVGKTFWLGSFADLTKLRGRASICLFRPERLSLNQLFSVETFGLSIRRMAKELLDHNYRLHYRLLEDAPSLIDRWRRDGGWPAGAGFFSVTEQNLSNVEAIMNALHSRHENRNVPMVARMWTGDYRRIVKHAVTVSSGNVDTTIARSIVRYAVSKGAQSIALWHVYDTKLPLSIYIPLKTMIELSLYEKLHDVKMYVRADSPISKTELLEQLQLVVPACRNNAILSKYGSVSFDELGECIEIVDSFNSVCSRAHEWFWVFNRAADAAEALTAARRRGVRVPRDLSILTFDDNPGFYDRELTTCVLDWNNAGYLMAHALIGDIAIEKTSKGFMRVKADIYEGATT